MKSKLILIITFCFTFVTSSVFSDNPPSDANVIKLQVIENSDVSINMKAIKSNTNVWIETSPQNFISLTIGTAWTGVKKYTVVGTSLNIYGNVSGFFCNSDAPNGSVMALDISNNPLLTHVFCNKNQISNIDVSRNVNLAYLACYDNNISTEILDKIYCDLPNRTGISPGAILPVFDENSANNNIVIATNSNNAKQKNWQVGYAYNSFMVETTGDFDCTSSIQNEKFHEFLLYPNPSDNFLNITSSSKISKIEIYNTLGVLVYEKNSIADFKDRIDISHLKSGIYYVTITNSDNKTIKPFVKKTIVK